MSGALETSEVDVSRGWGQFLASHERVISSCFQMPGVTSTVFGGDFGSPIGGSPAPLTFRLLVQLRPIS